MIRIGSIFEIQITKNHCGADLKVTYSELASQFFKSIVSFYAPRS